MTRFDEAQLRRYQERHPRLFNLIELAKPKPVGQAPNGYPNEAAFQVAAKAELEALGWHVQESLKGSSGCSDLIALDRFVAAHLSSLQP